MLCSSYEHEYSVFVKFGMLCSSYFEQNCQTLVRTFLFVDFHENYIYSAKDYFYLCEDFLLVLTFLFVFLGANLLKIFVNLLFGNIYEWSGALVKFYNVFFSTNLVYIVSYS